MSDIGCGLVSLGFSFSVCLVAETRKVVCVCVCVFFFFLLSTFSRSLQITVCLSFCMYIYIGSEFTNSVISECGCEFYNETEI
jgi:hypothetical protein